MSRPNFTSFLYDVQRQGFDDKLWTTISGTAAALNGAISFTGGGGVIVHNADMNKGEFTFLVQMATPAGGMTASWGLANITRNTKAVFNVSNTTFQASTQSEDTNASSVIAFNPLWNGAQIVTKIRWEAGLVKFFINGTQVGSLTVAPHEVMALYMSDNGQNISLFEVSGTAWGYNLNNASDASPASLDRVLNVAAHESVTTTENYAKAIV